MQALDLIGRSISITDTATMLSLLRQNPFDVTRQQAAFRPFSDVRLQVVRFARTEILPAGGDNTSFHSSVVAKIAADARSVGAVVAVEVQLRQVQGGPGRVLI